MKNYWMLSIVIVCLVVTSCSISQTIQADTQPVILSHISATPTYKEKKISTSESYTPVPLIDTPTPIHTPIVVDLSISPNGEWIAETIRLTEGSSDLITFIVRSTTGDTSWTVEESVFEDGPFVGLDFPYAFTWSSKGDYLFFTHRGGGDGCFMPSEYSGKGLDRLDLVSGDVTKVLDRPSSWMALAPGEENLAYVESWDQLILRNMETGVDLHLPNLFDKDELACPVESAIYSVYWSPRGEYLLATYLCGPCGVQFLSTIIIIDMNNLSTSTVISQSDLSLLPVEWSEPDLFILKGIDGEKWEYYISTGKLVSVDN